MHVDFSPPDITDAECQEVVDALRSGWITTGPRTKTLEKQVAQRCGTTRAACLNSATASLELTSGSWASVPETRSSSRPTPTRPLPPRSFMWAPPP